MIHNSRFIEIEVGTRFGDLTVVGESYRKVIYSKNTKTTRAMFPCVCKCGRETSITGTQLRTRKRNRCSDCAYRERPQSKMVLTNLERMFNLSILSRCKGTKIKNYLSLVEFESIISKNCYYCGEEPRKISYLHKNRIALREDFYASGVDRIDSSKDYIFSNCVPCCKKCNIAKAQLSQQEFKEHIKKIYIHIYGKCEKI